MSLPITREDRSRAAWTSLRIAPLFAGVVCYVGAMGSAFLPGVTSGTPSLNFVAEQPGMFLWFMGLVYVFGALPAWIGGYVCPGLVLRERFQWADLALAALVGAPLSLTSPFVFPSVAVVAWDAFSVGWPAVLLAPIQFLAAMWVWLLLGSVGAMGVVLVKLPIGDLFRRKARSEPTT